jgi:hypothetical protein
VRLDKSCQALRVKALLLTLEDKIITLIQNVGKSSVSTPQDIISQGCFTSEGKLISY